VRQPITERTPAQNRIKKTPTGCNPVGVLSMGWFDAHYGAATKDSKQAGKGDVSGWSRLHLQPAALKI